MRRISARGSGNPIRRRPNAGYILIEAIVLLAVLAIGAPFVVAAISAGIRELYRQVSQTAGCIEEENAQSLDRISDIPARE